jgi:histone acetyltransferase SAS3
MAITDAQAAEAELQQSVMLSEDEADYEPTEQAAAGRSLHDTDPGGLMKGDTEGSASESSLEDLDDMDVEDRDASGEEAEDDIDAEGEEDEPGPRGAMASDDDEGQSNSGESDDGESDDGEDAVGAVKIQNDAPEESDQDSDVSSHPSAGEDSDEVAWEDGENAEDDDEDDEDSEAAQANVCMYCKQDEENDPSEDFETYLTCISCKIHGTYTQIDARMLFTNSDQLINNVLAKLAP